MMQNSWNGVEQQKGHHAKAAKKRKRSAKAEWAERARSRRAASGAFYDSPAWKDLRYMALKLHGARCQCCGATRFDGVKIQVDHIKPRRFHPELSLELSNLQVLCGPCNEGKGSLDETDWRGPLHPPAP